MSRLKFPLHHFWRHQDAQSKFVTTSFRRENHCRKTKIAGKAALKPSFTRFHAKRILHIQVLRASYCEVCPDAQRTKLQVIENVPIFNICTIEAVSQFRKVIQSFGRKKRFRIANFLETGLKAPTSQGETIEKFD